VKKGLLIGILCVIIIAIITVFVFAFNGKKQNKNDKLNVVVTTFSTYDFVRQIAGDTVNINYLLGPGVDSHSFEPSSNDLIKIKNADMFIYIGGEMEKWVDKILGTDVITSKTELIKVTDCVETIEEQEVDGAEEHEEEEGAFDEHIWTSPKNAINMVNYLNNKLILSVPENKEMYNKNAESYIAKIEEVDSKIREIVNNKKRDRLVFGDKMPMQYFINEYGLKVSAAFNGCSTETEPSTKTITGLVERVKNDNIPVVLYIELSTGKTAKTIAQECNVEAMQIQTLHNISKDDFNNGESYVSLMLRNLDVLRKALQ
jgi:zinc transport system substrate-binding protein